ncbi:class A beta-lactamase-related serine hydrolase [Cohnella endophytica]|uniref:Class A beta-lactamase-related serine hydrolase n=1 Tax=Cohnella endophytica TaxID=2419778 RepID=A0A494XBJ4_9BACL|nr:serine hydrolase domain-containing protein [Cohnella endophytica]RKP47898.1 class A beta-lactamase-related serine hydrolase [Cohnella endophytica]
MISTRTGRLRLLSITILVAGVIFLPGCSKDITNVNESTLEPTSYAEMDLPTFLEAEMQKRMKQYHVPGAAIAVIHQGHLAWSRGFGYANVKKKIKVDEKTIFQVASNSKSVNSWGILKLVEQGKLELDKPVDRYLTRWHIPESSFNMEEVTICRLLSHTAGLSLHGYPGYPKGRKIPTLEESLSGKNSAEQKVELIYEPGTQYQYSGGGYTLLQLVVEEVTKRNYSDYMKSEILNPLGMDDSLFALHSEEVSNLAVGYNQSKKAYPTISYRELAAAGLHTNVVDFAKFVAALVDDKIEKQPAGRNILSKESLGRMFTPVLNNYGLGFGVISGSDDELITHSGSNIGYQSTYYINRTSGDGVVILTNSDSGGAMFQEVIQQIGQWEFDNQSDYHFGFDLVQ